MKPSSANEKWLVFDLESDGLYDVVTKIHCIVIHDVTTNQTSSYGPDGIADAIAHLATADVLIGHNICFYDIPVLQKLHSFASKARIIDTLICTRLIWPKEKLYDLDLEQYPQVPSNLRGSASLKAWGWRLADHKINFKDFSEYSQEMLEYCMAPHHKVLRDDLSWVECGSINVGDTILGFDEYGPNRKFKSATVLAKAFDEADLFEVTLQSGKKFHVTKEHRWLTSHSRTGGGWLQGDWVETQDLRTGPNVCSKVPRFFVPWEEDTTKEAGWLAGMFDGEGCLSKHRVDFTIAQKPGLVLKKLETLLSTKYGKDCVKRVVKNNSDCLSLRFTGNQYSKIEFLGKIRPERLISKFNFNQMGRMEVKETCLVDSVVSVKPIGKGVIVKLTTDSATFVLDGYPMHNCNQDVSVTTKLWKHIVKENYPEPSLKLEHDFALAINKQIRAGVPFDVDACIDLVDDLRAKQTQLEAQLKDIFPPIEHRSWFTPRVNNKTRGYVKGVPFEKISHEEFNPGSRQQIVDRLKAKYGWEPEKTTEKGNPVLDDEVLEKLPYPEAKPLAEYMLIKKRLGQIADGNNAWLKLVNNDTGRMHGDVVTSGCITGRCAHRNPNMGQVPAGYSPYGKECRSLFHAPQGWDMIGIDAKALELRCLAGYLALWDGGEYARVVTDPEIDIHVYNQERFGVPTRDISKRLLYACVPSDITTVLTKEGWKRYEELKVGQLVLTYNEEKEIKEWKPILEIIPEHEDNVWQIEHNHSFKVQATADHRWYVKQRKANKNNSCGWFTGDKQRRYMEPEVRTTETINTESNIIVNAPLVDLDSSGLTIDWKWRKYGTDWSKVILQMNSDQRKAWLSGFMIADGFQSCRENQKEKWHWTQLRNEHFEAALLASYLEFSGVIHVAKPRLNPSGTTQMHVSIANKGHVTGQKLQKTLVGKKKVFCIRTENKSFVMRQGDCITITGNCLYGAGALKMGTIINPNEKDEETLRYLGKTAIKSFMKGVPALQELKNQIDANIATRGHLIGLDRRILYCRSAFKGLNVLLQSAGAILMKQVVINIHKNIEENLGLVHGIDWEQVLMIHDEVQLVCKPQYTEAIQEQAMSAFPQAGEFFGFLCPIEGDSRVGSDWSQTH